MAERLVVDAGALREGARQVDAFARLVREAADTLVDTLLQAEPVLAGASTGAALGRLTEAVAAVHADLGTAVDGLAAGLERTAEVVLAVDVSLAGR